MQVTSILSRLLWVSSPNKDVWLAALCAICSSCTPPALCRLVVRQLSKGAHYEGKDIPFPILISPLQFYLRFLWLASPAAVSFLLYTQENGLQYWKTEQHPEHLFVFFLQHSQRRIIHIKSRNGVSAERVEPPRAAPHAELPARAPSV